MFDFGNKTISIPMVNNLKYGEDRERERERDREMGLLVKANCFWNAFVACLHSYAL